MESEQDLRSETPDQLNRNSVLNRNKYLVLFLLTTFLLLIGWIGFRYIQSQNHIKYDFLTFHLPEMKNPDGYLTTDENKFSWSFKDPLVAEKYKDYYFSFDLVRADDSKVCSVGDGFKPIKKSNYSLRPHYEYPDPPFCRDLQPGVPYRIRATFSTPNQNYDCAPESCVIKPEMADIEAELQQYISYSDFFRFRLPEFSTLEGKKVAVISNNEKGWKHGWLVSQDPDSSEWETVRNVASDGYVSNISQERPAVVIGSKIYMIAHQYQSAIYKQTDLVSVDLNTNKIEFFDVPRPITDLFATRTELDLFIVDQGRENCMKFYEPQSEQCYGQIYRLIEDDLIPISDSLYIGDDVIAYTPGEKFLMHDRFLDGNGVREALYEIDIQTGKEKLLKQFDVSQAPEQQTYIQELAADYSLFYPFSSLTNLLTVRQGKIEKLPPIENKDPNFYSAYFYVNE